MPRPIVTLAADKGGMGKTAFALEVAAGGGAVLIDLDHSGGGATSSWGYSGHRRARDRLTDSLLSAHEAILPPPAPRPVHAQGRAALIPSDPALGVNRYDPSTVARTLQAWAEEWDAPVVIDTHPGLGELAAAAMASATLTLVPVTLRRRDIAALAAMLDQFRGYSIAVAVNMVPPRLAPGAVRTYNELAEVAGRYGVPILAAVTAHPWWPTRERLGALVCEDPEPARLAGAIGELRALTDKVWATAAERMAAA